MYIKARFTLVIRWKKSGTIYNYKFKVRISWRIGIENYNDEGRYKAENKNNRKIKKY